MAFLGEALLDVLEAHLNVQAFLEEAADPQHDSSKHEWHHPGVPPCDSAVQRERGMHEHNTFNFFLCMLKYFYSPNAHLTDLKTHQRYLFHTAVPIITC